MDKSFKRKYNSSIIDMHTHLNPEYIDEAVRIMDRNSISMMFDITPNFGERLSRLKEAMSKYPSRFGWFGGIDFSTIDESGWVNKQVDNLERFVEEGAAGIKLAKGLGLRHRDKLNKLIRVDDERISPIIDKAGELGCVVAFHTADPKAFFEPLNKQNERWEELHNNPDWWFGDRNKHPYTWWDLIRQLETVILRHPNTTIMGVHFGCAAEEVGYVVDIMRHNSNYIVDIAARVGELGRHEATYIKDIFIEFQDRILFGTDLGVNKPMMLGAPQPFEPTDKDIDEFYAAHWRYFETEEKNIDHPTPIQGDWQVNAIDLPKETLSLFYKDNATQYLLNKN